MGIKETPTGISIDNTSGAVTVNYQGVQNGSEVSVSETHGNSDASPEARANVPMKKRRQRRQQLHQMKRVQV